MACIIMGSLEQSILTVTAFSTTKTTINQQQLWNHARRSNHHPIFQLAVSQSQPQTEPLTVDDTNKNKKRPNRRNNLPPGRPTLPFLSFLFDDTLQLLNPKTMASYQTKRREQYESSVFKTNIFFSPTVVIAGSKGLSQVVSQESGPTMEACFPPHHRKLFGQHSLLVISGSDHTRIRRLIQPSIASPGTVQSFANVIERSVSSFFLELESDCRDLYYKDEHDHHNSEAINNDKQDSVGDSYIELVPRLRSYLVSLMLRLLLGPHFYEVNSTSLAKDVSLWSQGLLSAPLTMIPWSTAAKAMRARARVVKVLQSCLDKERHDYHHFTAGAAASASLRRNETYLLSRLVQTKEEDGSFLTNDEIIDNIFTLIFAGSDTTASAVTSLWMILSQHPKLQDQLRDSSQDTTKEQLVQSILKSFPPAPFSMRKSKAALQVDGYDIPANWLIVYGLAGAMQEQQERQDDMDWDSWLFTQTQTSLLTSPSSPSSRASSPLTSNWVFGGGPRMCPGRFLAVLELSIICKQLLSWRWELDPHQNLEQRYTPGFFPVDGLRVRHFEKRI